MLGYASLFVFCTVELGYSEAEANSRIRAMRLSKEVPSALSALVSGQLSLAVASRAQACFRRDHKLEVSAEKKQEIVSSLFGKKIREADRILATHFSLPPPQERVIPLSAEFTKIEFVVT